MFRRVLASSRYIVLVPIVGTFLSSVALMIYEFLVVITALIQFSQMAEFTPKNAKLLAVGLIEAVDVFLIAIAMYIISMGLYSLFVDSRLPLPRWLEVHNLEDLKANLVSVVIAVLAVLFLRQAVAWEGESNILAFGAALALIIGALTLYLFKQSVRSDKESAG